MRYVIPLLSGVVLVGGLVGCAASPAGPAPATNVSVYDTPAVTASALCFDPPITIGQTALDLSRQNHGEAAFVGFEEPTTNYFDTFSYDRQTGDGSDRYERDSVGERVGVLHR